MQREARRLQRSIIQHLRNLRTRRVRRPAFIVMQLLEGKTLRQWIEYSRLKASMHD